MKLSVKSQSFILILFTFVSMANAQTQTPHEELQNVFAEIDAAGASAAPDAIIQLRDARNKVKLLAPKFLLQEQYEESGSLVLRDDWFVGKFDKKYVGNLTIRDTGLFLGAAVIIADGMLSVAKKELADATRYLDEWRSEEHEILTRLAKLPITENNVKAYTAFLNEWREEVKRVDIDRFQNALTQAAYSILRVSEGIEKQHVDNVRNRIAAGPTRSGSAAGSSGRRVIYSRSYPFHERMMNHIYKRNDRLRNRATRIRARR